MLSQDITGLLLAVTQSF